ncbi:MAG: hypothetical protein QOE77_21 [Blastocatellia bacterium]|jgi:3',5'-cyclic AMP phosphodiesterase CpdA|nr:hypothetical protein [Blastocatellia bacterium]
MDDFKPFLQIVHISDLHVTDPRSPNAVTVRQAIRKLSKYFPSSFVKWLIEGVAPHDRRAVGLFKTFLGEITAKDKAWSKCKTWLVDTGDLTSLGDKESLKLGREFLDDLAKVCPDIASIYGNHDAWPGKLPFWLADSDIEAQKLRLKTLKYRVADAGLALQTPIPNGSGEVQLYFVDSISHDWWPNLRAQGEVTNPLLEALQSVVDQNYQRDRKDFRILAVHHPVHYPPSRPHFSMSMKNDTDVAATLDRQSPNGAYPLAHLVLSGHTHSLYPEHGKLPSQPSLCLHPDLGDDECQFVVGSLMQLDWYGRRGQWPHHCEVLRMYYSESEKSVLLMERLVAARLARADDRGVGIGKYRFVSTADKLEEDIAFNL